jgi:hypothetical protein
MKHSLIVTALACLAVCGCEPKMKMPVGFVEVPSNQLGIYKQRAVSADGVVIALREEDNHKGANLDFWATAVRNELVERRGYRLVKDEPLSRSGDVAPDGRLFTFAAKRAGVEFTYLTAVYVAGGRVTIAEAGGKAETVSPMLEAIRKSLSSLQAGL